MMHRAAAAAGINCSASPVLSSIKTTQTVQERSLKISFSVDRQRGVEEALWAAFCHGSALNEAAADVLQLHLNAGLKET